MLPTTMENGHLLQSWYSQVREFADAMYPEFRLNVIRDIIAHDEDVTVYIDESGSLNQSEIQRRARNLQDGIRDFYDFEKQSAKDDDRGFSREFVEMSDYAAHSQATVELRESWSTYLLDHPKTARALYFSVPKLEPSFELLEFGVNCVLETSEECVDINELTASEVADYINRFCCSRRAYDVQSVAGHAMEDRCKTTIRQIRTRARPS